MFAISLNLIIVQLHSFNHNFTIDFSILLHFSNVKSFKLFYSYHFLYSYLFFINLIFFHFVFLLDFSIFSMPRGWASFPSVCPFLLLSVITLAAAQNFETGDNSTVRGCSNHCSYKDKDLDCWNKTLVFFEKILLGQMRNYVAVQMNIEQWRKRHVHPEKEEWEQAKRHSIATMKSQLHHEDVIDEKTIETVVDTLVDLAAHQTNHTLLTWMPHFQCPIPCEHRYTVWRNLFVLSSVLNVCLFIAILPLVKRMHNSDASEALIQRG